MIIMTQKSMREWFFMRDGFDSFRLQPERNRELLFGDVDRERRDGMLAGLEEGCYGLEGYKAVMYGDYGRGKTHQCQNLIFEIGERQLPLKPVYVKCTEYKAKESFSSLFVQMLLGLGTEDVKRVAQAYLNLVNDKRAKPIDEIVGVEDIARVFQQALGHPNTDTVRIALKWLGGEKLDKEDLKSLPNGLTPLSVSRDFAAVMKGMAEVYREIDRKVLVFLIDEAEQFKNVVHHDTATTWVASLRALTELIGVGFIFFVGANSQDEIPEMLTWDEIATRIGTANYWNLPNPGHDAMRQWVLELFQTYVRKGEVPTPLRKALGDAAKETDVPPELRQLVGKDPAALDAYPFTPNALETFVNQSVSDQFANKPREVLIRIQRAAGRAMRLEQRQIDEATLEAIRGDGF